MISKKDLLKLAEMLKTNDCTDNELGKQLVKALILSEFTSEEEYLESGDYHYGTVKEYDIYMI